MAVPPVNTAAAKVLSLLVGRRPQTVTDLVDKLKVTRTAVTEQLSELQRCGLVDRERELNQNRGRPRYRYTATCKAMLLFNNRCGSLLAEALLDAVENGLNPDDAKKVVDAAAQRLADRYANQLEGVTDPRQRVESLVEMLREDGVVIDLVEEDNRLHLYRRSCPFIGLPEQNDYACLFDEHLFKTVAQVPVHRAADRHEGDECCGFFIDIEGTGNGKSRE